MTATATPTASNPAMNAVSGAFHTLLGDLALDLVNSGSGLMENFFASIQANPSVSNVIAQGLAVAAAAPLALPNLEQSAIAQTAAVGANLTAQLKAMATTAVTAA